MNFYLRRIYEHISMNNMAVNPLFKNELRRIKTDDILEGHFNSYFLPTQKLKLYWNKLLLAPKL